MGRCDTSDVGESQHAFARTAWCLREPDQSHGSQTYEQCSIMTAILLPIHLHLLELLCACAFDLASIHSVHDVPEC